MAIEKRKTLSAPTIVKREAMLRNVERQQPVLDALSRHIAGAVRDGRIAKLPALPGLTGLRRKSS